jgi:hypothetical protein
MGKEYRSKWILLQGVVNDMRLIDIEPYEFGGHAHMLFATEDGGVFQMLSSEIPTIDAVPVVRCEDCKYVQPTPDGRLICGATLNPNWVSEEHFCSYGERKDGEG